MSKVITVKLKATGETVRMKERHFHPSFHEIVVEKKEAPKKVEPKKVTSNKKSNDSKSSKK